jgi:DNA repair protein RecO (recombination protein O)
MARGHLVAYVLHSWDWSESSLIVDLFTREQGRIVVVAKGAKKPHSNLRAVLLPLQRIVAGVGRLSGEEGASEIQTLRSAEWAGPAPMPAGAALFAGFYLNELLMKLLARHDPHPALFDAYAWVLDRLGDEPALRAFELLLLRETGVLPELATVTLTQQPVREGSPYALKPEAGVVDARRDDAAIDGAAWIGMQAALQHGSPDALRGACVAPAAALKSMLRTLLHYHLGGSSLRTRDVMLGLQDL